MRLVALHDLSQAVELNWEHRDERNRSALMQGGDARVKLTRLSTTTGEWDLLRLGDVGRMEYVIKGFRRNFRISITLDLLVCNAAWRVKSDSR